MNHPNPSRAVSCRAPVRRWPGYSAAVQAHGLRSAFAFPLQVGSAPLGVLDVYREQPGDLGDDALADSLALASVAAETLIEGQGGGQGRRGAKRR